MIDTVSEQLRIRFEQEFNSRFEKEVQQPMHNLIHNALLIKPMSLTEYVPMARETSEWLKNTGRMLMLKEAYINTRMSEAANFIKEGMNNGT
jgi:hypothetical protein